MRSSIRATLVAALFALSPAAASAQLQVGLDLDAIFPTDDFFDQETGFGIAGRLGLVLPLGVAELVPEVQLGYIDFGAPDIRDAVELDVVRATAGARLGFGAILRPTVFAHIGYGRRGVKEEGFFQSRGGLDDENALTWDVGAALDLAILPLIDLGLHAAYNRLETERALDWVSAGAHASITF